MSAFPSWPLLWAQAAATPPPPLEISPALNNALVWFFLAGEPSLTLSGLVGGLLTWLKAVGLLSLFGWVGYWVVTAVKERVVGVGRWFDYLGLAALALIPLTVLVQVMQEQKWVKAASLAGVPLTSLMSFAAVIFLGFWALIGVWRTIGRLGRRADYLVLVGMGLAFLLGLGVGLVMARVNLLPQIIGSPTSGWRDGIVYGARLSVTYMGFVVLLRVAGLLLGEVLAVRGRRLYAIARVTLYESNRKMWAPWVVVIVFGMVLAFTHWFLQPPRAAEMGRLYVGTLTLLCSLLLTSMVTILAPISLPTDIQQQTIYTVVTKPVRRLEIVWGRMLGYMALVTVLVAVFGGVSLAYLWRTVQGQRVLTTQAAEKAQAEGRTRDAAQLFEQADQLASRMAARVPVKGSLSFLDSKGNPHAMGIDVGQEQSMKEPRSHIEGATPATAIWRYGVVPDPFSPPNRPVLLDRRIDVTQFLPRGTVEGEQNRMFEIQAQIAAAEQEKSQPSATPAQVSRLEGAIARNKAELERAKADFEKLAAQSDELKAAGKEEEAAALHAPLARIEMTFNIYRTTKGEPGKPVYAEIEVTNSSTGASVADVFPIKEYYTNRRDIDPGVLVGSLGNLKIEVRCISPTQYLGMAESDLYLLADNGNFGVNYMKGLFGIWLQAMVLTAIGVFAGTFLSWPVALLTTIAFFIAGQLAFGFLIDFTRQAVLGGGPFESLIRLVTHDNQMSELAPTAGVVVAKTLDSLVMPIMSMLVYVVPNFQVLDVTNTVADGFAVDGGLMVSNTLLALAYTLPFSVAGYFILKNREVAA
ncbi:ATP:cob(I)alamin adenosyltransferase [Paludisphaera soli]|uniref:ATP:cob(I)alamin adenosyltransferase n=1 Tax=Paludisphaera soli TaxID=2712865 RepID=UPI0013ED9AC4|nr:ATP:cob(I)alamin adenosyltransferase [Paludisphaera soli]